MSIEVTQEMVDAFGVQWHGTAPTRPGTRRRAGIKAVLAIVERDYEMLPRQAQIPHATVILFTPSGGYHAAEDWEIPPLAIGPYDMERSPDFRRIDGGAVLVPTQEPWGYPHLFPGETTPQAMSGFTIKTPVDGS